MKKNMLYIMHVDWDWIKQRPHFIGELLNEKYNNNIFYSYGKERDKMKKNNRENKKIYPFFKLPLRRKSSFIRNLNEKYLKLLFSIIIKIKKIDIIWITHPELYNYIPKKIKVIYDCMDDNIFLETNKEYREYLSQTEKQLIENSYMIFVTSENLKQKLIYRYDLQNKKENLFLNRNAYNGEVIKVNDKNMNRENKIKICYVGTVSSWFDEEVLKYILKKNINIEIHIIGPMDNPSKFLNSNENIKIYGPIKHELLYDYIKKMDILIMNFQVNEIISSVDPVKLYEYINYNKPIISVYYPEIKRFKKYVEFYNNKKEFYEKINKIVINNFSPKYSLLERLEFLNENTWTKRVSEIIKKIGE